MERYDKHMTVKVLYFGMVSEATQKKEETLSIHTQCTTTEFDQLIKEKYTTLKQLPYNIAIDQQISVTDQVIPPNTDIALLPPFAGG